LTKCLGSHILIGMKGIRVLIFTVYILSSLFLFGETQTVQDAQIYVIPIKGEIDRSLKVFVRRSIEKALSDNVQHLIFEIDTFGGRVDSALQLAALIGSLSDVTTTAYVGLNPEGTAVSWSAGALIAFSANRIYMAPGTSMGSAAPIIQSPEGTVSADEKAVSALRTQMAAIAEKNNYPKAIAIAMVDSDSEVLEAYLDDELQIVTRSEFESMKRTYPEDRIREGSIISAEGKILALTAGEMEKYGVSSGTFSTLAEVAQDLKADGSRLIRISPTSADQVVTFLTGAAVTSILVLIGIIGLFMEISSPGFGIPGAVALIAFAILFTGNALLGTVGSLELIIFVLGIALLVVEIFLIPGFGAAGISGIILMISGLVLSMQDFVIPSFSWQWDLLGRNILIITGNVIAAFIAFGILAFLIPKYTPFKRLTLSLNQEASKGYTSQNMEEVDNFLNKTGIAVTTLRPSGKASIEGEVIQVETAGEYVEKNTEIIVTAVNGNRILVRRKP
jgi:membrane-bound serine protease (ClpP class)